MSKLVPAGMRSRVLMLAVGAWLYAGVQGVSAQQPSAQAGAAPAGNSQGVLMERNRGRLHPGEPLTISGREAGDNDARSRTPALARSDRVSTVVNADEHYQRTLAMYEGRTAFHQPLRAMSGTRASRGGDLAAAQATQRAAQPAEIVASGSSWPWVLGLLAFAALVVLFVKQRLSLDQPVPAAASQRSTPQRARARA